MAIVLLAYARDSASNSPPLRLVLREGRLLNAAQSSWQLVGIRGMSKECNCVATTWIPDNLPLERYGNEIVEC